MGRYGGTAACTSHRESRKNQGNIAAKAGRDERYTSCPDRDDSGKERNLLSAIVNKVWFFQVILLESLCIDRGFELESVKYVYQVSGKMVHG